jgi:hypothetical protein
MRNLSNETDKKKSLKITSPVETERQNESKRILVTDTMDAYKSKERELSREMENDLENETPITNHQGLTHLDG